MKENFFISMLSEGTKRSSKRWIAVTTSAIICFGSVWGFINYREYFTSILYALIVFVSVMSGVATLAQIISLIKGVPYIENKSGEDTPKDPPHNP